MAGATLTFLAYDEAQPGPRWQSLFERLWPGYERWFLKEGESRRATYQRSRQELRRHLPELLGVYDALVELAGGGDLAARMLSMYEPPPYLAGCSQAAWTRGAPALVRNYDYAPERFEAVVAATSWTGRRVVGTSDCLWGLLDGMNDAGLAVSLTFGGRRVLGSGFGIPVVVRYLLETCTTVPEATAALARIPVSLAHNLTLVDAAGRAATAYLAPDRRAVIRDVAVATNHQLEVEWHEHAAATRSLERECRLRELLDDPGITRAAFVDGFLHDPLYSRAYERGFGTLYTVAYYPLEGRIEYRWPGRTWAHGLDDVDERTLPIDLPAVAA
jgi:predicted choloylglycine hydrolase